MPARKLSRINNPLRRRAITILIRCLSFASHFFRQREHIHWVGGHLRRRRPESALFAVMFLGTLVAAGPQRQLLWITAWGGMLAIFLNLLVVYLLLPRKRAHWIR